MSFRLKPHMNAFNKSLQKIEKVLMKLSVTSLTSIVYFIKLPRVISWLIEINNYSIITICEWNVSAVILLTAYASSSPAPSKDSCQAICAGDYKPVCGKPADGKGTNITFGTKCVLDNYNCQHRDKREIWWKFH